MAEVLATPRLSLREQVEDDAPFILALLNDPAFLQYIGDKGVRTIEDARTYIRDGQIASYAANGFGLYLVSLKSTGEPIGMCGLVSRPLLHAPDIGYAFMPAYRAHGYAREAARAVLEFATTTLGFDEILAIVSVDNAPSAKLLESIGLTRQGLIRMREDGDEVALYSTPGSPSSDATTQGSTTARS